MASVEVVLKHETSTLRQRHNFISIDLTIGVSDYVREVTGTDKVDSGPMSGRDATWGQLNLVISETMHPRLKLTMERCQQIMVALSEYVTKKAWSAPWRRTDDDVIFGWQ